jgi:predicted TIM-barrel fold metal-dependent hydrolase
MSARRIDVHLHIIPPFYQDVVREAGLGPSRRAGYPPYSPELALDVMDANEIEVGLTSVAQPGVHFAEPEQAKALARRLNEHASELQAQWPKRFGALATVPMRDVKDAVAEVEHALDVLKHDGVSLFASYGEKFLGDAAFDPLMDALNQRKAVVFIHPTLHPSSRTLALPWPAFMMEYLFDTTRAAVNLLMGGTIDRYPDISFILPHAGGTLPFLVTRIGGGGGSRPPGVKEPFDAYLRRLYYDTAGAPSAHHFASLLQLVDIRHVLYGSDWAWAPEPGVAAQAKTLAANPLISDADRERIGRLNALELFPRLA